MKKTRVFETVLAICLGVFLLASISVNAGMTENLGKIAGKATSAAQQLLDINSATAEQLQQLPGVGEKIAERIVKYREENGPFSKIEDLLNVEGIDEKKLKKIRPLIEIKQPGDKKKK